ncbi:hypothetical protein SHIRM173S_07803 [Streptomyces hirsutus]
MTEVTAWESSGPRRAGINAFGFGGTNAHAVLEQAPPRTAHAPRGVRREEDRDRRGPSLLTLSAGSAAGLDAWTARVSDHLGDHPESEEGDVCLAAGAARDERPHRLAVVAAGDLRERLASVRAADGSPVPGSAAGTVTHRPRTVYVFPGQGGLRPGQGRELYATAPVYRATLDEASGLVGAVHGRELTAWCVDGDADGPAACAGRRAGDRGGAGREDPRHGAAVRGTAPARSAAGGVRRVLLGVVGAARPGGCAGRLRRGERLPRRASPEPSAWRAGPGSR